MSVPLSLSRPFSTAPNYHWEPKNNCTQLVLPTVFSKFWRPLWDCWLGYIPPSLFNRDVSESLFAADILKVSCANVSWNFGCLSLFWDFCHLETGSRPDGKSKTSFPNNGGFVARVNPVMIQGFFFFSWPCCSLVTLYTLTLLLNLCTLMFLFSVTCMCQKNRDMDLLLECFHLSTLA